jgi:hypothetical protein
MEILTRVDNIMIEIGETNYSNSEQTTELFNLNNIIFPNLKEFGVSCSSCRSRVYNRLKEYWIKNKLKE